MDGRGTQQSSGCENGPGRPRHPCSAGTSFLAVLPDLGEVRTAPQALRKASPVKPSSGECICGVCQPRGRGNETALGRKRSPANHIHVSHPRPVRLGVPEGSSPWTPRSACSPTSSTVLPTQTRGRRGLGGSGGRKVPPMWHATTPSPDLPASRGEKGGRSRHSTWLGHLRKVLRTGAYRRLPVCFGIGRFVDFGISKLAFFRLFPTADEK